MSGRGSAAAARRFRGRPLVTGGAAHDEPLERPVFVFDQALTGLEHALYRHLIELVDLDAVFDLEQALWARLEDLEALPDELVLDVANTLIARAFERLGHDPARALRDGVVQPDGSVAPAPAAPHGECPLCERGAAPAAPDRRATLARGSAP